MPRKRIWLYAAILFILAGSIVATQVSLVIQSARVEESFINQRINMALCSAMDVLSKDKGVCSSLESCTAHSSSSFELVLKKNEKQKIDSVILQHLLFYNISAPFNTTFSQTKAGRKESLPSNQALLYPVANAGMQNVLVNLEIPSKNQLIRAQINGTFILSILMLGLLMVVFVSALKALAKERSIRKETVDFVNTMAHDLKTPISNISFALSLFTRQNENINPPGNQYLTIINEEINKLKDRAIRILGVASVDAVLEEESNKTHVDVHELINESIGSFALKLNEARGEVRLELNAQRHIVFGSELQLLSALKNIIDNAITYCSSSPLIEIRTKNADHNISIEIVDNGSGIPEREKDLIFKKGYRIHRAGSDGFGLGLYLSKTLIEKQEGELSVISDGTNGSTFITTLPVTSV